MDQALRQRMIQSGMTGAAAKRSCPDTNQLPQRLPEPEAASGATRQF
jgi:hypothetical protein